MSLKQIKLIDIKEDQKFRRRNDITTGQYLKINREKINKEFGLELIAGYCRNDCVIYSFNDRSFYICNIDSEVYVEPEKVQLYEIKNNAEFMLDGVKYLKGYFNSWTFIGNGCIYTYNCYRYDKNQDKIIIEKLSQNQMVEKCD